MRFIKHPYVQFAGKLLFTTAALYVVFMNVPFRQIMTVLLTADWIWLIPALLLFILSKVCSSFRLYSLFSRQHIPVGKDHTFRLYWIGMFYNFLLPGGIGGDGYKLYKIRKIYSYPLGSIGRVLLWDRISGLVALCNLAGILYLFITPAQWVIPVVSLIVLCNILFFGCVYLFVSKTLPAAWPESLSWLVQIAQLACAWCLLLALHISEYSILYLFVFLLSSVASAFPLSIGGLGAREFIFLQAAALFPVEKEKAVCIGLLFYLISLLVASSGAIYLIRSADPNPDMYAKL